MKKLALVFAAGALAMSGGILAETDDSQPAPEVKKPDGFVLLQRNIYVPVDSQGKIASEKWIVIEKQGFVTPDEFEALAKDAAKSGDSGGTADEGAGQQEAPTPGEQATPPAEPTAATPSTRGLPSVRSHPPLGEGPMIRS
ncbi:MAG TPA: hypothetical protein VNU21_10000 [Usitatibacter sp.]|jgi:hypothetical protein|nr:hypothetical protein [Usitatibacter sp.]